MSTFWGVARNLSACRRVSLRANGRDCGTIRSPSAVEHGTLLGLAVALLLMWIVAHSPDSHSLIETLIHGASQASEIPRRWDGGKTCEAFFLTAGGVLPWWESRCVCSRSPGRC